MPWRQAHVRRGGLQFCTHQGAHGEGVEEKWDGDRTAGKAEGVSERHFCSVHVCDTMMIVVCACDSLTVQLLFN